MLSGSRQRAGRPSKGLYTRRPTLVGSRLSGLCGAEVKRDDGDRAALGGVAEGLGTDRVHGAEGDGLVMPHRRRPGEELPNWKQARNKSHKQVRARVAVLEEIQERQNSLPSMSCIVMHDSLTPSARSSQHVFPAESHQP